MRPTKPQDCRTIKPGDLVEYSRENVYDGYGPDKRHVGLVLERDHTTGSSAGFPIAQIQFTDDFHGLEPVWIDCNDLRVF